MSLPFRRPGFANIFYVFAVVHAIGAVVVIASAVQIARTVFGPAATADYGLFIFYTVLGSAATFAAIGYAIEKLAKIEWNTRPENQPGIAPTESAPSWSAEKRFYVITSGRTLGPLTASGVVNLYRDGKLTRSSQVLAEENGTRRAVTDWSEFGL